VITKEEIHEWVNEGTGGRVMCDTCRHTPGSDDCYGCPMAWRAKDGKIQYYKEPIHGSGLTEEM